MVGQKRPRQNKHRGEPLQDRGREADPTSQSTDRDTLGPAERGTIVAHYGATLAVEDPAGKAVRCSARRSIGQLACGDRVIWRQTAGGEGVVVERLPRRSSLERPDARGERKIVAANLDRIVIVVAVHPEPSEGLIDRYLVAAETAGIEPLLVVNKIDLLDDQQRDALEQRLRTYEQIGYAVLFVSAKTGSGIEDLAAHLRGHTSLFVGQSGTGKSSLTKRILPERDIRIGSLSQGRLGRHTTTTSVLYQLPFGGQLIDSPGVRDFAVWDIDPTRIADGFVEFRKFRGQCKFSDCSHDIEPGCALRQAVRRGEVDPRRLASYHKMMQEARQRR